MLLYVTGPRVVDESRARAAYAEISDSWPTLAGRRVHPRTGAALVPAVTRLDLFLAAFSPAAKTGESGLAIDVPPPDRWWRWAPALRRALHELIRSTFPPGPRYAVPLDPVGPATAAPAAPGTAPMRTLVAELRRSGDPAQRPADPRLWLVLAPPLPAELETIFLSTFLRAEPFARIARAPEGPGALGAWLDREVDGLLAGDGLAVAGLVADFAADSAMQSMEQRDDEGRVTARSEPFDLVSGLEELYASREVLEPGEAYNRLHSHSGAEELYVILEGEGLIRVNERVLPIRAGQCFGKPRGYDCCTQLLNTGAGRMMFLDVGTANAAEVDLCRYPEHGEVLARFGGHRWLAPLDAIVPGSALCDVYDRRYFRTTDHRARTTETPTPR
jgi:uncharacterized cupin superfamily protein